MMEALRGTISVLTIILIYQLLDQKRFELERRYKVCFFVSSLALSLLCRSLTRELI
jgi:hypothetical protein